METLAKNPDYLSAEEACKELNVSSSTLFYHRLTNKVTFEKEANGDYYYTKESVLALKNGNEAPQSSASSEEPNSGEPQEDASGGQPALGNGIETPQEEPQPSSGGMAVKTCSKCGATKSRDEFYNNKSTKDGKQSSCKPCFNEQVKESKQRRKKEKDASKGKKPTKMTPESVQKGLGGGELDKVTKICPKCNIEKKGSDFGKHKNRPDGLQAWCKECLKTSSSKSGNKKGKDKSPKAATKKTASKTPAISQALSGVVAALDKRHDEIEKKLLPQVQNDLDAIKKDEAAFLAERDSLNAELAKIKEAKKALK